MGIFVFVAPGFDPGETMDGTLQTGGCGLFAFGVYSLRATVRTMWLLAMWVRQLENGRDHAPNNREVLW